MRYRCCIQCMRGCDVCGRVYGERGAATGEGPPKKKQNLSRKGWVLRMATARLLSGGCGAPVFSLKSRLFLKTHQNIGKSTTTSKLLSLFPSNYFFGGGRNSYNIFMYTHLPWRSGPPPVEWIRLTVHLLIVGRVPQHFARELSSIYINPSEK